MTQTFPYPIIINTLFEYHEETGDKVCFPCPLPIYVPANVAITPEKLDQVYQMLRLFQCGCTSPN